MSAPATLLLVDDEPHVVRALQRTLRETPYRIIAASSAAEALAVLARTSVDVVISDVQMPGMSGIELLSYVRSAHPTTVRILLTGGTAFATALHAINDCAVFRYLTKPWNQDELRAVLKEASDEREALRRAEAAEELVRRHQRGVAALGRCWPGADVPPAEGQPLVLDELRLTRLASLVCPEIAPQVLRKAEPSAD